MLQMRNRVFRPDTELTVRMFVVMLLLAALYIGFLFVLWEVGLSYSALIVIAAVLLGLQYYFSDRLVLASMRAHVVDRQQAPQLHGMVDRLVAMADLPKPRIAIVDSRVPNAFATGRNPRNSVVAVTTGLVNRLDEEEVEAVLAHELTHIKNRDSTVLTLASFFATVAFFVMRSGLFFGMYGGGFGRRRGGRDGGGAGAIVIIYIASLIVWAISFVLIRTLSRYREFAADRGSAIITGAPSTLASALRKISGDMGRIPTQDLREMQGMNAFFIIPAVSGQSIMELFSTHPSLEKRLERLERMQREMEGFSR
ncbi:MAG: zinc metalloprotease HtpX [Dehalococcoidales bacterium]|nr:zinc metalloprotease HtpX [Dehalococcoidales bacterium]